jgi:hypothetical protein
LIGKAAKNENRDWIIEMPLPGIVPKILLDTMR